MKTLSYKTITWSLLLTTCFAFPSCENDKQKVGVETFQFAKSETPVDTLDVDEVRSVVITPTPENITEKIIWSSSNSEIVQVQSNEQGLVAGILGVKVGNTVITASTPDGRISQSFPVNVIVKVKNVSLSNEMIMLSPDKGRYDVIFDPANATIQDLFWTSSKEDIAGIDPASGLITAVSPGSTIITATTKQGGKSATIEVFVSGEPPVLGKEYCSITADNLKGSDYSADKISTSGAIQDLSHSNTSIPSDYYKFYEGEKLVVQRGELFTLELEQSNDWSRSLVWIDWNGDKDFADKDELTAVFGDFFTDSGSNPGPFSKLITVPNDAVPGFARMRIITGDAWTLNFDLEAVEPCGVTPYGTIKDFEIEIR